MVVFPAAVCVRRPFRQVQRSAHGVLLQAIEAQEALNNAIMEKVNKSLIGGELNFCPSLPTPSRANFPRAAQLLSRG